MPTYSQACRWAAENSADSNVIKLIAFIYNRSEQHVKIRIKELIEYRQVDKRKVRR